MTDERQPDVAPTPQLTAEERDLGMGAGWHTLGGWVGLATGLDALYLSFAEVTNATAGRAVIGVGGPILKS